MSRKLGRILDLDFFSVARQEIPRPPWARRVDAERCEPDIADPAVELTIGAVRDAFSAGTGRGSLPAQDDKSDADAAVMILLVPAATTGDRPEADAPRASGSKGIDDSASSVVLIRRATHMRVNPGEIAFPGGRIEPGESPLQAGLRESREEVALVPSLVEVIGELPVVHARRSVPVLPFVAVARGRLELKANVEEVESILVVPLRELVAPGRYWQEHWVRDDGPSSPMHFFDMGDDVIWGATARMLYELYLRLLSRGSGGKKAWPPGERTPRAGRVAETT